MWGRILGFLAFASENDPQIENLSSSRTSTIGFLNINRNDIGDVKINEILASMSDIEVENVKIMNLDRKELTEVPLNIIRFKNLEVLYLDSNKITTIASDTFLGLPKLKKLSLNNNKISTIESSMFESLAHLEELCLLNNQLTTIGSSVFQGLSRLKVLILAKNEITTIDSDAFKGLLNLNELYLSENRLSTLKNDTFKRLTNLESLWIPENSLTTLDSRLFEGLSNLKQLYLHKNKLETLEDCTFKDLSSLGTLVLSNNELKTIKKGAFKGLSHLSWLECKYNQLTAIDEDIFEGLSHLKTLDLSNNQLKRIDSHSFQGLSRLQELSLANNQLSVLPASIRRLRQLAIINLQNNPNFQANSNNDPNVLGREELTAMFGDRISFESFRFNGEIIDEVSFLAEYKTRDLHWNLEKLKDLRLKEVEKTTLSENDMIEIVDKAFDVKLITLKEKDLLVSYINVLHDPEVYYTRWRMYEKDLPLAINLLGFVLKHLDQVIDKNMIDFLKYGLNAIAESVEWCPDRQISALKDAYAMIHCDYQGNELFKFIENKIVALKENEFKLMMTPYYSTQNVHVLNYWTYELKDILGFGMVFEERIGTMKQDPFGGHRGNALKAFLDHFTPEYVIGILTDEANKNNEMMCELMNMIDKDDELSAEEKLQLGVDALDYQKCKRITQKAVEYLLFKMNLIKKAQ